MKNDILITGANGFIGQNIKKALHKRNIVSIVKSNNNSSKSTQTFEVDLSKKFDISSHLKNVDVVIHTAGKTESINVKSNKVLQEFNDINVRATKLLAEQAAKNGVSRFIFISSIKVNGENTNKRKAFTSNDRAYPADLYAKTKLEAELELKKISSKTGMKFVIIRPPLVYGQDVKGNFANLIKLIKKNIPLPLGRIKNQRSIIAIDNLVSLIINCIDNPKAANQLFLCSDGEDLSTSELITKIAKSVGKKPLLLPTPTLALSIFAFIFGKKMLIERLKGSLQIDISSTCKILNWKPVISVDDALKKYFFNSEL